MLVAMVTLIAMVTMVAIVTTLFTSRISIRSIGVFRFILVGSADVFRVRDTEFESF